MIALTTEWVLSKLSGHHHTTLPELAECALNEGCATYDIRGVENTKFLYEFLESLLCDTRKNGHTTVHYGGKTTYALNWTSPDYDKETDSIRT